MAHALIGPAAAAGLPLGLAGLLSEAHRRKRLQNQRTKALVVQALVRLVVEGGDGSAVLKTKLMEAFAGMGVPLPVSL